MQRGGWAPRQHRLELPAAPSRLVAVAKEALVEAAEGDQLAHFVARVCSTSGGKRGQCRAMRPATSTQQQQQHWWRPSHALPPPRPRLPRGPTCVGALAGEVDGLRAAIVVGLDWHRQAAPTRRVVCQRVLAPPVYAAARARAGQQACSSRGGAGRRSAVRPSAGPAASSLLYCLLAASAICPRLLLLAAPRSHLLGAGEQGSGAFWPQPLELGAAGVAGGCRGRSSVRGLGAAGAATPVRSLRGMKAWEGAGEFIGRFLAMPVPRQCPACCVDPKSPAPRPSRPAQPHYIYNSGHISATLAPSCRADVSERCRSTSTFRSALKRLITQR